MSKPVRNRPAKPPVQTSLAVQRPAPEALPKTPPATDALLPDPDSPRWGLTTKAIIAVAILLLGALVIWRFQFLISPLVLAAVVAYLLNPVIRWLQIKLDIKRTYAVLIIYAILLLVVGGASVFLGLVIAEQSVRIWESLPEFLPRLVTAVQQRTAAWSTLRWTLGPYSVVPGALLSSIDWQSMAADIGTTLQSAAGRSGLWLAGVAGATLGTLGDIFFVLIVSIYLAMDSPRIGRGISEVAHQPGYRRDAERLIAESIKIWDAYLRGQVILGIVIFAIVTLSLTILGVNNALELGILSGLLEFLPIVGPIIGAAAAVLVALVQDTNPWGMSPWLFALVVLGVMIVIQQIENVVLVPRIVGDALDLHALVVLIGVLMGTSLAGLLGAVLAAPVIATLKLFGTYTWRKMLDLPPFVDEPPDKAVDAKRRAGGGFAWLTGWFGSRPS
jgi:predicted PurR-regulated permease PerM